jgi:hypothetical protein
VVDLFQLDKDSLWTIRTRTVVNIPVALVWQQKTVSIVAPIVKQLRPGRRSLADVGTSNVLAELTEVKCETAFFVSLNRRN